MLKFIVLMSTLVFLAEGGEVQTVDVYVGDMATLTCEYPASPGIAFTQMEWKRLKCKGSEDCSMAILNKGDMMYIPDSYVGLVFVGTLNKTSWTIVIPNVKLDDAAQYQCSVTTFPVTAWDNVVHLRVTTKPIVSPVGVIILSILLVAMTIVAVVFIYLWWQRGQAQPLNEPHAEPLNVPA